MLLTTKSNRLFFATEDTEQIEVLKNLSENSVISVAEPGLLPFLLFPRAPRG